jgi:hypothetical protein
LTIHVNFTLRGTGTKHPVYKFAMSKSHWTKQITLLTSPQRILPRAVFAAPKTNTNVVSRKQLDTAFDLALAPRLRDQHVPTLRFAQGRL